MLYCLCPSVNVHGRNGKMDNVLKNEGVVHLRLADTDFRDSAKIGEGGEAVFKKLTPQYKGQKTYPAGGDFYNNILHGVLIEDKQKNVT
jgi:hypothetical protein